MALTTTEYSRHIGKDYILRDYNDLLIAFTVSDVEYKALPDVHESIWDYGVNYFEVADEAALQSWTPPTFDNYFVDSYQFNQYGNAVMCRVIGTNTLYRRPCDWSSVYSGGKLTGTLTVTGDWELLGDYHDLNLIEPKLLADAPTVAAVADLPKPWDLDALPRNTSYYIIRNDYCAVVTGDGVYRIRRNVSDKATRWGTWHKIVTANPWDGCQHVATVADLPSDPPPKPVTPDDITTQYAIVDNGDLLYCRSFSTDSMGATCWNAWKCIEPSRNHINARGFFTVLNKTHGINIQVPWYQYQSCWATLDEAAAAVNNLDLAMVEHTPSGLFFMFRDKGNSPLFNPYHVKNTDADKCQSYGINGKMYLTTLRNVNGNTYITADLRGVWRNILSSGAYCAAPMINGINCTPSESEGGSLRFAGVARTMAVCNELMSRQGRVSK